MTTGEVCRLFRAEEHRCYAAKLYHMIDAGYVDRPVKNGAGMFIFNEHHLGQIRAYLENPPRPGRKPQRSS